MHHTPVSLPLAGDDIHTLHVPLCRYSVGNGHSLRAVVDAVAATVGPAAAAHAVASAGGDAAVGRARRIHTAAVGLVVKARAVM